MEIKKIFFILRQFKSDLINMINFKYHGVVVGKLPGHIEGTITIRAAKKGSIVIGEKAELRSGKSYNIIGGDTRLILRTIGDGKITIGDHVGISNSALVSAASIIIEDDVMIGGSCKIWDTDFHSIRFEERNRVQDHDYQSKSIHIKRGAFIGGVYHIEGCYDWRKVNSWCRLCRGKKHSFGRDMGWKSCKIY